MTKPPQPPVPPAITSYFDVPLITPPHSVPWWSPHQSDPGSSSQSQWGSGTGSPSLEEDDDEGEDEGYGSDAGGGNGAGSRQGMKGGRMGFQRARGAALGGGRVTKFNNHHVNTPHHHHAQHPLHKHNHNPSHPTHLNPTKPHSKTHLGVGGRPRFEQKSSRFDGANKGVNGVGISRSWSRQETDDEMGEGGYGEGEDDEGEGEDDGEDVERGVEFPTVNIDDYDEGERETEPPTPMWGDQLRIEGGTLIISTLSCWGEAFHPFKGVLRKNRGEVRDEDLGRLRAGGRDRRSVSRASVSERGEKDDDDVEDEIRDEVDDVEEEDEIKQKYRPHVDQSMALAPHVETLADEVEWLVIDLRYVMALEEYGDVVPPLPEYLSPREEKTESAQRTPSPPYNKSSLLRTLRSIARGNPVNLPRVHKLTFLGVEYAETISKERAGAVREIVEKLKGLLGVEWLTAPEPINAPGFITPAANFHNNGNATFATCLISSDFVKAGRRWNINWNRRPEGEILGVPPGWRTGAEHDHTAVIQEEPEGMGSGAGGLHASRSRASVDEGFDWTTIGADTHEGEGDVDNEAMLLDIRKSLAGSRNGSAPNTARAVEFPRIYTPTAAVSRRNSMKGKVGFGMTSIGRSRRESTESGYGHEGGKKRNRSLSGVMISPLGWLGGLRSLKLQGGFPMPAPPDQDGEFGGFQKPDYSFAFKNWIGADGVETLVWSFKGSYTETTTMTILKHVFKFLTDSLNASQSSGGETRPACSILVLQYLHPNVIAKLRNTADQLTRRRVGIRVNDDVGFEAFEWLRDVVFLEDKVELTPDEEVKTRNREVTRVTRLWDTESEEENVELDNDRARAIVRLKAEVLAHARAGRGAMPRPVRSKRTKIKKPIDLDKARYRKSSAGLKLNLSDESLNRKCAEVEEAAEGETHAPPGSIAPDAVKPTTAGIIASPWTGSANHGEAESSIGVLVSPLNNGHPANDSLTPSPSAIPTLTTASPAASPAFSRNDSIFTEADPDTADATTIMGGSMLSTSTFGEEGDVGKLHDEPGLALKLNLEPEASGKAESENAEAVEDQATRG